ncbi:MAG: hypothetical protein ACO32L_05410, partial [Aquiluna sp.]
MNAAREFFTGDVFILVINHARCWVELGKEHNELFTPLCVVARVFACLRTQVFNINPHMPKARQVLVETVT